MVVHPPLVDVDPVIGAENHTVVIRRPAGELHTVFVVGRHRAVYRPAAGRRVPFQPTEGNGAMILNGEILTRFDHFLAAP